MQSNDFAGRVGDTVRRLLPQWAVSAIRYHLARAADGHPESLAVADHIRRRMEWRWEDIVHSKEAA